MRSVKRLRQRASLFGALLGVIAIVSGLGVGLVGYLLHAENQGTRVEFATRTGADAAFEVSLARDADPVHQDATMRELLASRYTNSGSPIPIRVDRTVVGDDPVPVRLENGEAIPDGPRLAEVVSIPNPADLVNLADGSWPNATEEVAVQVDAADALGVGVGDRFTLGDAIVTVAATWTARSPLDPRWVGEPLVSSGVDGEKVGLVLVNEDAWDSIARDSRARWTITPIVDLLRSSDLVAIVEARDGLREVMREAGLDTSSYDDKGRLERTVLQVQSRVDALRAVEPVALLVVAAVALVTVLELARLLGSMRSSESLLMWSRGATPRALAVVTAIEAAIVAGLGAALGAGASLAVLYWEVGGAEAAAGAGAVTWLVPSLTVLVTALIFGATAFGAARSYSRHDKSEEAGRARRAAGPGAVVLVTVAAALSTWQLLLYGTPLTPSRDGGAQVDPVAVVAPALALVSLVLLALLATPLVAPLAERRAQRTRGVRAALVSRTLSRRLAIAATPLVVVGLATGQVVLAAAYAQTWDRSYTLTSQARAGADLRLTGIGDDLAPAQTDAVIESGTAAALATVHRDTVVLGLDAASLVAVSPAAIRDLMADASGFFDPAAAAETLTTALPGTVLPETVTGIQITVATQGVAVAPELAILLVDEYGSTRTLQLGEDYRVSLPGLAPGVPGTWRFLGVDVTVPKVPMGSVDPDNPPKVQLTAIASSTGEALDVGEDWTAYKVDSRLTALQSPGTAPGAILEERVERIRLLPAMDVKPKTVISQALADLHSVTVGDVLFLQVDPRADGLGFAVAAIAPVIPGSQSDAALLVDLGVIQALQQRSYADPVNPRLVWVEGDTGATAIEALREQLPAGVRIESLEADPSRAILQTGSIALWVAAIGCCLLATTAVAAVVGAQLRTRRPEVLLLRALGVSRAAIAGIRRRELLLTVAAGAIIGIVAGVVVTLLTVTALARAAVPLAYVSLPTTPEVDPVWLAIALAALALLVAVLIGVYGAAVSNQVRRSSNAEDAR